VVPFEQPIFKIEEEGKFILQIFRKLGKYS
jgi:hypothetical protein